MNLVVGSGPAGMACADALLARGEPVTLVDAGLTLEPERQSTVARMREQAPAEWSAAHLAHIKEGMDVSKGGIAVKRLFGSDFAYRGPAEHIGFQATGAALVPSLARGGLSNVWGAALLPYSAEDLAGWPLTLDQLEPHYAAAIQLTGLAGRADGLARHFPLYGHPTSLPMSRQAGHLWSRLEKHADFLQRHGLLYGAARLAVQASGAHSQPGCVTCGLCMYGCPYDFIYHTGQTLRTWGERRGFSYQPGILVERVTETGGGVQVTGYHLHTKEPWSAQASRVFLAGGVLPSTKIVLQSQDAYDRPLPILDSQYYLFPMLQAAGTRGVREESLYTLSQLFIELFDAATLGQHTVHLQVYSYSDLIGEAVRQALGPLGRWGWLRRELEGRFLIVQGYLHSHYSSRMRVQLQRSGKTSALRVEAEINPETSRRVRRVVRKLLRFAPSLRAVPLEPFLQITAPGRGFHSGGSLPMRAQPGPFETDTLGRPHGWDRIHVVDSSVFPTIPATTITFSVMANAHRIGCTVAG